MKKRNSSSLPVPAFFADHSFTARLIQRALSKFGEECDCSPSMMVQYLESRKHLTIIPWNRAEYRIVLLFNTLTTKQFYCRKAGAIFEVVTGLKKLCHFSPQLTKLRTSQDICCVPWPHLNSVTICWIKNDGYYQFFVTKCKLQKVNFCSCVFRCVYIN